MADRVWLLVMFDLPVVTSDQRRDANRYRNLLYDQGFSQVQLSVYSKYLLNSSGVRRILPVLRGNVPAQGEVRVLKLTDEQWSGMSRYYGPQDAAVEAEPTQLFLALEPENEGHRETELEPEVIFDDGLIPW